MLPKPLPDLYTEAYLHLSYLDLLQKSEDVYKNLSITSTQAEAVEKNTRGQCYSKLWFQQRAARITASKLKGAVRTDVTQPSRSLIRAICYPESTKFSSKATDWGCSHEKQALTAYQSREQANHSDHNISCSGFVISTDYPHMGASPDGIVDCTCYGRGVLEVKCPYSCTDKTFIDASSFSLSSASSLFLSFSASLSSVSFLSCSLSSMILSISLVSILRLLVSLNLENLWKLSSVFLLSGEFYEKKGWEYMLEK